VQRHGGLAGSRAARHDRHAGRGGADRVVLLPLDGRDDVPHAVAGGLGEAGQQRPVADHPHLGRSRLRVEQVVGDAGDPFPGRLDHPAPDDPLRVGRGGPVERRRRRRAPVDDQRFRVLAADAEPAHVVGGAGGQVEAAEDQALTLPVQRLPAPRGVEDHRVALDEGLEGAGAGDPVPLLLRPGRVGTQLGEAGVDAVDVLLLDRDLLLQNGGVVQCRLPERSRSREGLGRETAGCRTYPVGCSGVDAAPLS
jgi:hypothetical protein